MSNRTCSSCGCMAFSNHTDQWPSWRLDSFLMVHVSVVLDLKWPNVKRTWLSHWSSNIGPKPMELPRHVVGLESHYTCSIFSIKSYSAIIIYGLSMFKRITNFKYGLHSKSMSCVSLSLIVCIENKNLSTKEEKAKKKDISFPHESD